MKKNEKINVITETLYHIEHNEFTLTHDNIWLWVNMDKFYRGICSREVTYGILSVRHEKRIAVFPEFIFVCCQDELDDLDKFFLRFVDSYSTIIYLNKYPLLPAPKITFIERKIKSIKDAMEYVKEVFRK